MSSGESIKCGMPEYETTNGSCSDARRKGIYIVSLFFVFRVGLGGSLHVGSHWKKFEEAV